MKTETRNKLRQLKKRLDNLALEQLREVSADLHARLEQAEIKTARAQDDADFWHDQALEMQLALSDEGYASHRCVGINIAGEMLVIKTDQKSTLDNNFLETKK